jgi:hypothetical protein
MAFQRQPFSATQIQLENERGFVTVFALSLMPLILAAGFAVFFSYFLSQNWMQSLHSCRTVLLETQESTGKDIDRLMSMNSTAKALRLSLAVSQTALAAALAHLNFPVAIQLTKTIKQIRQQQRFLDQAQKAVLLSAKLKMVTGVFRAKQALARQNLQVQRRLPSFFGFSITDIRQSQPHLAVKPDSPDLAPVYELEPGFNDRQALHLSWKSQFTTKGREQKWFNNTHQKKDACSASLKEQAGKFQAVLSAAKFL